MSSLGQLVAGIAHEINNPVNFIYANVKHLENYNQRLIRLIGALPKKDAEPPASVQALLEDIDLGFLVKDSTDLLNSLRNGSNRIKQIAPFTSQLFALRRIGKQARQHPRRY